MHPGRWLRLTVSVPGGDADRAAELAAELVALGGAAVEERGDRLVTYVLPPPDPTAFVAAARERLSAVAGGANPGLEWDWQASEDWAALWRKGLEPRRVGDRIIVTPSWTTPRPGPGDVVITIDPQMAFGTGEHATTRASLRLLERALRSGDRVLDVGTGSGILAIAAARLGAGAVVAVESDPDAILNARENIERNGVAGSVALVHAEVAAEYLAGAGRFDVITANVLSGVLRPLLAAFRAEQPAGGRLVLSGILTEEAAIMRDAAERANYRLAADDAESEWWSALLVATQGSAGPA